MSGRSTQFSSNYVPTQDFIPIYEYSKIYKIEFKNLAGKTYYHNVDSQINLLSFLYTDTGINLTFTHEDQTSTITTSYFPISDYNDETSYGTITHPVNHDGDANDFSQRVLYGFANYFDYQSERDDNLGNAVNIYDWKIYYGQPQDNTSSPLFFNGWSWAVDWDPINNQTLFRQYLKYDESPYIITPPTNQESWNDPVTVINEDYLSFQSAGYTYTLEKIYDTQYYNMMFFAGDSLHNEWSINEGDLNNSTGIIVEQIDGDTSGYLMYPGNFAYQHGDGRNGSTYWDGHVTLQGIQDFLALLRHGVEYESLNGTVWDDTNNRYTTRNLTAKPLEEQFIIHLNDNSVADNIYIIDSKTYVKDSNSIESVGGVPTLFEGVTINAGQAVIVRESDNNFKFFIYNVSGSYVQASSPPEFTNVSPSNGFRVGNSNVTYTLDQDLAEGTVTWTATAGTDTASHSVNLVETSKHTTGTHTVSGPSGTSLVDGVTYTVKLNGKNSNDDTATEVEITGLVYDTLGATLSNIEIVGSESSRPRYVRESETVTLSFTSNEEIETPTVKFICNDTVLSWSDDFGWGYQTPSSSPMTDFQNNSDRFVSEGVLNITVNGIGNGATQSVTVYKVLTDDTTSLSTYDLTHSTDEYYGYFELTAGDYKIIKLALSAASQEHTNAVISNPQNNDWTAVWTVPANRAGLVTFEITTFDKSAPSNSSIHWYALTTPADTVTVVSSAPEFTNVTPSNGFRVGNSNVTYTLNQDLAEGTITWTATSGTDTASHSVNLVTDTKHTTGTHTVTGPTGTSLVDGVTYTVKLNGKNSDDDAATEVEITGLVYDTVAPTLSNVEIVGSEGARPRYVKESETVTLSFTSNEEIETPTVKIICNDGSGASQEHTNAVVSNPQNNDWTAVWTVPADRAGLVTFEITTVDKATPSNNSTHTALTTPADTVTVEIPSNELEKVHDLVTILSGGGNHTYTIKLPNSISDISSGFAPVLKNKLPGTHYTTKLGSISDINTEPNSVTYNDFTSPTLNEWLAAVPENSGSDIPVLKLTISNPYDSGAATQDYYITVNRPDASGHKAGLASDLLRDSNGNAIALPSDNITPVDSNNWTEDEKRSQTAYSANQLANTDFSTNPDLTAIKTVLKNALAPPASDASFDVKNSASKMRNNIMALIPEDEDVTDMLQDSFPNLPAASTTIIAKKPSPTPILPEEGKALYIALAPGEVQKFGFAKHNHKFKLTKMGDYKYKGAWIEEGQSSELYTVPSSILGTTTVKCGLGHTITSSLFNDNGLESSAGHPLPFKLNVNGEIILIGSAVVAGDDGSGTAPPADFVSSADTNVLTAGLTGVSEETGRGDLKMKKITDSATLTKAQALIDAESDATNKLALRANILRSILDHSDMAASTSIKMSKTSLGLDTELASAVTDVVAFKADQTVKLSDLENTEGFYAPLINDGETFTVNYGNSKTATFTRQTVASEVQYSLTVSPNVTIYKRTGATNLTVDNSNYSVSGYLLAGDKIELGGRLITIGSLIDGGESITLEYANVSWTNVYDPNTTSFEDNIIAANPTVALQTYNKDITVNGNVITVGNMKYVMFENDTTINFSN